MGIALTVECAQRGINCALVERRLTPQRIPKGQNLSQRTLEHFYFWHCVEELRAARLLPPGYPIGGITAYGNLMSDYWHAPAGREVVQPFYFQRNERLPQYLSEAVLRARAAELPAATCLFGWSATDIEQDDDAARVTIHDQEGGRTRLLEADFVVGCDGAHSGVREQIGIDRWGPDYDQRMVLAVFRSRELHEGLKRFPERTTYRVLRPDLRGYWQFFGRVDVGDGWFFHAPVPRGTSADNYDFRQLLVEAAGFPFSCTFDYVGLWDLRVQVASTYRKDRVFIAGDAAHSHPPYGGFGLNSGLEDVANLGWKLEAALGGWGGDALLDSYSEERQPVFVETGKIITEEMIGRDRAFLDRYDPETDRGEFEAAWQQMSDSETGLRRYEPQYEGSPVVFGPPQGTCGAYGEHSVIARPGHHLTPQVLSSGRNVFEMLGTGFTLLSFGCDGLAPKAFQAAADSIGMPLTSVEDSYEDGRADYRSRLVLVRPDQHVAWVGDEPPRDASSVLRKVAGLA